jgi:hypothetical protein
MTASDRQRPRWLAWLTANDECRRAAAEWDKLRESALREVSAAFCPEEALHLRHTAFRINALVCLYSRLGRRPHDPELGVLLGAITHLVDYVYDHPSAVPSADYIGAIEAIVLSGHPPPIVADPIQAALVHLVARAWALVAAPEALAPHLAQMLRTQRQSMRQMDGMPMDDDGLRLLTINKGHHSLCLYFAAVNPGFTREEADALRPLGAYMQLMDDIEDFHEDRSDGRQSTVSSLSCSFIQATRLFRPAMRGLIDFYHRRDPAYGIRILRACFIAFHVGILCEVILREAVRRLPARMRHALIRFHERAAARVPIFHLTPVGLNSYRHD